MSATFEPQSPRGGTGVLILRLIVAGLMAALGVVLWTSGHVLIGGLILALAVVRLVLFFTMRHRRTQWRQTRAAQRGGRGGAGPGPFGQHRPSTPYGRPSPGTPPGAAVPYDPPV